MATLSEHAETIKAAIQAAKDEGYRFEIDVTYDAFDSSFVRALELDIWEEYRWINVYTEER